MFRPVSLVFLFALLAVFVTEPSMAPAQPPKAKKDDGSKKIDRSEKTRKQLLKDLGGSEESERAVMLGLEWLAKQQKKDGGWDFDDAKSASRERIAATGMALLPFLAAGVTHDDKQNPHSRTVLQGLLFLARNCPLNGAKAGQMTTNAYAQAIGTIALCEAYAMTKDKARLLAPAQAAVKYIQNAQGPNGSWGYTAQTQGDTSIVGWQIQALHAAKVAGLEVDARVIKNAIAFLDLAGSGSNNAAYGYRDGNGATPGTSLTAVGLLCRYYIDGWGPDNTAMAEGVTGLMKRSPTGTGKLDMYFYYYATQVVRNFGGKEWQTWNEGLKQADGVRKDGMRDTLIKCQEKKAGPNLGSWEADPGSIGTNCGRLGTTALSILTLQAYYRYTP